MSLRRLFVVFTLSIGVVSGLSSAHAQAPADPEFASRELSVEERAKLTEILNKPLDLGALKINLERQIHEKWEASMKLGDRKAEEELTRIALENAPSIPIINNMARIAVAKSDFPRAIELHKKIGRAHV